MNRKVEFKNFYVGNINKDFDITANGRVLTHHPCHTFEVEFNNEGLFFNCDKEEEWVNKAKQYLKELWTDYLLLNNYI